MKSNKKEKKIVSPMKMLDNTNVKLQILKNFKYIWTDNDKSNIHLQRKLVKFRAFNLTKPVGSGND